MAIFGGLLHKRSGPLDEVVRQAVAGQMPMPGAVSGYGGGTFTIDGQQVTPIDGGAVRLDPAFAQSELATQRALRSTPQLAVPSGRPAIDPEVARMIPRGPEPEQRAKGFKGFMQRFGRDIMPRLVIAGAIVNGDYQSAAQLQGLYARQVAARQESEREQAAFGQMASFVAGLPGMTAREFAAFLNNPETWATQNAEALTTHFAAATVGQTETRVFGDPTRGGHTYQPTRLFENGADQMRYDPATGAVSTAYRGMTDGEQYARSLGLAPGSPEWNNAVRDAKLGANGPTAFGYGTRRENQRQGNRLEVRRTPPARVSGGSSRPTATGPNGAKVEWNGRAWVPVN